MAKMKKYDMRPFRVTVTKLIRKRQIKSIRELARMLNCPSETVFSFLDPEKNIVPSAMLVYRLAIVLHTTVEELLQDVQEKTASAGTLTAKE